MWEESNTLKEWISEHNKNNVLVDEMVEARKKEIEQGIDADSKDLLTLMLTKADDK